MQKPESDLENETYKILWDFEIETDHVIPTRHCAVEFAVPEDHRIKTIEIEKRDNYLNLARKLKKTMEHENDDIPIVIGRRISTATFLGN